MSMNNTSAAGLLFLKLRVVLRTDSGELSRGMNGSSWPVAELLEAWVKAKKHMTQPKQEVLR